jgi:hypothetical protein
MWRACGEVFRCVVCVCRAAKQNRAGYLIPGPAKSQEAGRSEIQQGSNFGKRGGILPFRRGSFRTFYRSLTWH